MNFESRRIRRRGGGDDQIQRTDENETKCRSLRSEEKVSTSWPTEEEEEIRSERRRKSGQIRFTFLKSPLSWRFFEIEKRAFGFEIEFEVDYEYGKVERSKRLRGEDLNKYLQEIRRSGSKKVVVFIFFIFSDLMKTFEESIWKISRNFDQFKVKKLNPDVSWIRSQSFEPIFTISLLFITHHSH